MISNWMQYSVGFTILLANLTNRVKGEGILKDGTVFNNFPVSAVCGYKTGVHPETETIERSTLEKWITYPPALYDGRVPLPFVKIPAPGKYYEYQRLNSIESTYTDPRIELHRLNVLEFELWRAGSPEAKKFERTAGDRNDVVRFKRFKSALVCKKPLH